MSEETNVKSFQVMAADFLKESRNFIEERKIILSQKVDSLSYYKTAKSFLWGTVIGLCFGQIISKIIFNDTISLGLFIIICGISVAGFIFLNYKIRKFKKEIQEILKKNAVEIPDFFAELERKLSEYPEFKDSEFGIFVQKQLKTEQKYLQIISTFKQIS